jgi:hypothetical protein
MFIQTILVCGIHQGKDACVPSNTQRTARSRWTSFRTLLATIRNMVPSDSMNQINGHYAELMVRNLAPIDAYILND